MLTLPYVYARCVPHAEVERWHALGWTTSHALPDVTVLFYRGTSDKAPPIPRVYVRPLPTSIPSAGAWYLE